MSGQWDWKNAPTMTANHTPTPTKRLRAANVNGTSRHWTLVSESTGGLIADGLYQVDADSIVACVNAHDALTARVAELEAVLSRVVVASRNGGREKQAALFAARAALAKGAA